MSEKIPSVSDDTAADFARRYGLAWLTATDMPALAQAMETIWRNGLDVPRVPSKSDSPASVFTLPADLFNSRSSSQR